MDQFDLGRTVGAILARLEKLEKAGKGEGSTAKELRVKLAMLQEKNRKVVNPPPESCQSNAEKLPIKPKQGSLF